MVGCGRVSKRRAPLAHVLHGNGDKPCNLRHLHVRRHSLFDRLTSGGQQSLGNIFYYWKEKRNRSSTTTWEQTSKVCLLPENFFIDRVLSLKYDINIKNRMALHNRIYGKNLRDASSCNIFSRREQSELQLECWCRGVFHCLKYLKLCLSERMEDEI